MFQELYGNWTDEVRGADTKLYIEIVELTERQHSPIYRRLRNNGFKIGSAVSKGREGGRGRRSGGSASYWGVQDASYADVQGGERRWRLSAVAPDYGDGEGDGDSGREGRGCCCCFRRESRRCRAIKSSADEENEGEDIDGEREDWRDVPESQRLVAVQPHDEDTGHSLMNRSINAWTFNVFTLDTLTSGRPLFQMAVHLFDRHRLLRRLHLDPLQLIHFLCLVEEGYHKTNPYHNAVHAADVTQAMNCFIQEERLRDYLTPLETLAALVAAIAHDLDHPGVNQTFLIATSHPLARLYANTSVLENHHWHSLVCLLRSTSLLDNLDASAWKGFVDQIQILILATDITKQHQFLHSFQKHLEDESLSLDDRAEDRSFVLQIALKCADICNPCRPWDISQRWGHMVCEEFFQQGDVERYLSLPVSTACDRYTTTIASIQSGFIEFVVEPLFRCWHSFMSSQLSTLIMHHLEANRTRWAELVAAEEISHSMSSPPTSSSSTERNDAATAGSRRVSDDPPVQFDERTDGEKLSGTLPDGGGGNTRMDLDGKAVNRAIVTGWAAAVSSCFETTPADMSATATSTMFAQFESIPEEDMCSTLSAALAVGAGPMLRRCTTLPPPLLRPGTQHPIPESESPRRSSLPIVPTSTTSRFPNDRIGANKMPSCGTSHIEGKRLSSPEITCNVMRYHDQHHIAPRTTLDIAPCEQQLVHSALPDHQRMTNAPYIDQQLNTLLSCNSPSRPESRKTEADCYNEKLVGTVPTAAQELLGNTATDACSVQRGQSDVTFFIAQADDSEGVDKIVSRRRSDSPHNISRLVDSNIDTVQLTTTKRASHSELTVNGINTSLLIPSSARSVGYAGGMVNQPVSLTVPPPSFQLSPPTVQQAPPTGRRTSLPLHPIAAPVNNKQSSSIFKYRSSLTNETASINLTNLSKAIWRQVRSPLPQGLTNIISPAAEQTSWSEGKKEREQEDDRGDVTSGLMYLLPDGGRPRDKRSHSHGGLVFRRPSWNILLSAASGGGADEQQQGAGGRRNSSPSVIDMGSCRKDCWRVGGGDVTAAQLSELLPLLTATYMQASRRAGVGDSD